jgi:hypothetical protein
MTNGAGLAIETASVDGNAGIEFIRCAGSRQRLSGDHAHGFDREIVFKWPAIDDDFAGAGREADARDSGLAAASAKVLGSLSFGNFDFGHLKVDG